MADSLFYDGNLQAGLSHALEAQKIIVIFVTDLGEESLLWQDEYLADPEVCL
jgi:hypothetical protein